MSFLAGLGAPDRLGLPSYFMNPAVGNNVCFNCYIFTVDTTKYSAISWWVTNGSPGTTATESQYDTWHAAGADPNANPAYAEYPASSLPDQFRLPFQYHADGLDVLVDWGDGTALDRKTVAASGSSSTFDTYAAGGNFLKTYAKTTTDIYAAETEVASSSSVTLTVDNNGGATVAATEAAFKDKLIYKADGTLFGKCTAVTNDTTIVFGGGTYAQITNNDRLYTYSGDYTIIIKPLPTATSVYAAEAESISTSEVILNVDNGSGGASAANDATFLNQKVYKSDGTLFGTCTAVTTTQLTFKFGIEANIANNDVLYVYTGAERIKGWQTDTAISESYPNIIYSRERDAAKMVSVDQWGAFDFSMTYTFAGCRNMVLNAGDNPYISGTDLEGAFACCQNIQDGNLGGWDVGSVTNMKWMFFNATKFNGDLGGWDTSSLTGTGLYGMFHYAQNFNQPISSWDISGCTSLQNTFAGAWSFNQNINTWDTSNVTNMQNTFDGHNTNWGGDYTQIRYGPDVFNHTTEYPSGVFSGIYRMGGYSGTEIGTYSVPVFYITPDTGSLTSGATSSNNLWTTTNSEESWGNWRRYDFNQPLNNWDVSNVTTFTGMFYNALLFDQDISSWNTGSAISMNDMFRNCYSYNQPVNTWDTADVTNMSYMFSGTMKFNQPLGNWNVSNVLLFQAMFYRAQAFNQSDINDWTLKTGSGSIYMNSMFRDNPTFNQSLSEWDTSRVVDMSYMFSGNYNKIDGNSYYNSSNTKFDDYLWDTYTCYNVYDGLGSFNLGTCTTLLGMFYGNTIFNQGDIEDWDTSNVTDMRRVFGGSNAETQPTTFSDGVTNTAVNHQCYFNRDINGWETTNVTKMSEMFMYSKHFNQDIGTNGDAVQVDGSTAFDYTFGSTIVLGDALGVTYANASGNASATSTATTDFWDVDSVLQMEMMFWGAEAFQHPLTDWDMEAMTDNSSPSSFISPNNATGDDFYTQGDMFLKSVYNQANYDLLLKDWDAEMGTASRDNDDCTFGISARYTKDATGSNVAQVKRHNLITDHNWRIYDLNKTNYSVHFDGSNDYLEASATPVFGKTHYADTNGDQDWSISFFFKVDALDSSKQVIMHFGAGADNIEFYITTGNKLKFESDAWDHTYEDANGDTAATLAAGRWYSVLYTIDRDGRAYFYINGTDPIWKDVSGVTHPTYTSSGTSYMGRDDSGNYFEGNIDLVYIYKGAVTNATGISNIAQGGEWDGRQVGYTTSDGSGSDTPLVVQTGADGKFPTYSWLMGDVRPWYARANGTSRGHTYPAATASGTPGGQGQRLWDNTNTRFDIPHNAHGTLDAVNNIAYSSYGTNNPDFILGDSSDGNTAAGPYWRSNNMVAANIEYDTPDY
mgnify:CR=1 FL=1